MSIRVSRRLGASVAFVGLCVVGVCARADAISDWNEHLVAVVLDEKAHALEQSRAAAIVHTAMFEAVNSIERRAVPARPTAAHR